MGRTVRYIKFCKVCNNLSKSCKVLSLVPLRMQGEVASIAKIAPAISEKVCISLYKLKIGSLFFLYIIHSHLPPLQSLQYLQHCTQLTDYKQTNFAKKHQKFASIAKP